MGLDRGRKPLGLTEAEERQGSRDYLESEIRLAKETSWDVARVRRKVVQRNRELAVLPEIAAVLGLRELVCSEELLVGMMSSGICLCIRAVKFLKELFGKRSRMALWTCLRRCCGTTGRNGGRSRERLGGCGRRAELEVQRFRRVSQGFGEK